MAGALAGVRVVDFGQWIAGPLTAMLLADQGAEVVHVDPPGGPRWTAAANATLNRGKTCVEIDVKQKAGREAARRLAASADVLVENFRPGVMERLGLGPDASLRANPRLIACSLPGFAGDDPRAGMAAWEGVIAAATGTYHRPGGTVAAPPRFTALPLASVYGALAAATAIVMALIARERDGLGQRIEVPLFDAMFLAIGSGGLLVDGKAAGGRPDDAWTGQYECAGGGWVRINLATPRFLRRFIDAAGRSDWIERGYLEPAVLAAGTEARARQQQELKELFRGRSAEAWEALGREADVPLTRVRTTAEWMSSDHARQAGIVTQVDDPDLGPTWQPGAAVRLEGAPGPAPSARTRAADIEQVIGRFCRPSAPGRPAIGGPLTAALEGMRVVDVTQVLAGPTAGRTLAEFGADVVKINNPAEEGAGYRWNVHRYHTDVNRGKRSILLDLKSRDGIEVFNRLVDGADVVLQNFRPGVAERLGIGYEQVRARRPQIVYGTVSMYGGGGPWAALPGYEPNAQAVSGIAERMAGPQPFAVDDYATGLLGAFGVGLALFHRQRTGRGQAVEASLARTATVLQAPYLQTYAGKVWDEPRGPTAMGWGALQRLYRAADGWFFLGAAEAQRARLAAVAGPAAIESLSGADLECALDDRLAAKPVHEWVRLLTAAGIGAQPLVSAHELMNDPWVVAHGLSVTRPHWGGRTITTIGPPARLSRTPARPGRPAPAPGGDAEAVLSAVGMAGRLDELLRDGVIALEPAPRTPAS